MPGCGWNRLFRPKSPADGGLGYGTVVASLVFATILGVALVRESREERKLTRLETNGPSPQLAS